MGAYEVEVDDAANIAKIAEKIQEIPNVNKTSYGGQSTQDMVKTLKTIQTGGSIFIVGLAIIALFMIANTLKSRSQRVKLKSVLCVWSVLVTGISVFLLCLKEC